MLIRRRIPGIKPVHTSTNNTRNYHRLSRLSYLLRSCVTPFAVTWSLRMHNDYNTHTKNAPFRAAVGPKSAGHMSGGEMAHCAATMVCSSRPNSWLAGPTLWLAHCANDSILSGAAGEEKRRYTFEVSIYTRLPLPSQSQHVHLRGCRSLQLQRSSKLRHYVCVFAKPTAIIGPIWRVSTLCVCLASSDPSVSAIVDELLPGVRSKVRVPHM